MVTINFSNRVLYSLIAILLVGVFAVGVYATQTVNEDLVVTGSVGIGTISPGAKLHVEGGGTSGSDGLRITSSASGTGRANFFPYSSDRFYHQ
ncbi:MAG: hypothetical protein ABIH49_02345, partial [archaeon]